MKRNYIIIFAAVLTLLSGCARLEKNESTSSVRLVTQITVSYEQDPFYVVREYTSGEKIRQVLNYLRQLKPYGTPEEDPEGAGGNLIRMVLSFSDGQQEVYEQRSDRYFKKNDEVWMYIDPQKAQQISMIMGQYESDQ